MSKARSTSRRVKVVHPNAPGRRVALYSVAVAVLAAGAAFYAWDVWRGDAPPSMLQRPTEDVQLYWLCANGHRSRAPGQAGARPCPVCGADAYAVEPFRCPDHGTFQVFGLFGTSEAGHVVIERVRVDAGAWTEVGDGPRCPVCGGRLTRVRDPAEVADPDRAPGD